MRHVAILSFSLVASLAFAGPFAKVVRTNPFIERVDVANNSEVTLGNTGFATDSLAVDPLGILYSADKITGALFNVSVPVPLFVGNTGFSQIGDLDYGNNGLWGFSNANQTLFFYNLGSNAVTYTQSFAAFIGSTVTGVAFRPFDGSIFLSANTGLNQDSLYVIPASSTAANLVGTLAISDAFSYVADIDFAPNGGLIAMSWFHRDFYSVNTTSGATSLISAGPHRDSTGMALPALSPVPGPAASLAWLTGTLVKRQKRRKRAS